MKKVVLLCFAAILMVSITACSDGNSPDSSVTNNSSPTNTLENSTPFNYNSFVSAFEENELRAKENYIGNSYTVSAFVRSVAEDSCILEILDATANDFVFKVLLPQESLMELNNTQRITVAGTIEQIEGRQILLTDATYIDGTSEVEATVLSLIYASASDTTPSYCTARIEGAIDDTSAPLCNFYLSGDTLSALNEDDNIAVSGSLYALSTNPLEGGVNMYHKEKILLEMKDAQLTNTP